MRCLLSRRGGLLPQLPVKDVVSPFSSEGMSRRASASESSSATKGSKPHDGSSMAGIMPEKNYGALKHKSEPRSPMPSVRSDADIHALLQEQGFDSEIMHNATAEEEERRRRKSLEPPKKAVGRKTSRMKALSLLRGKEDER